MILNSSLKKQIHDIFISKKNTGINSVYIGYKYVNGIKTNEIGLVFGVNEKISESDLPKDHILPKQINLDGNNVKTDVIVTPEVKLMSCYPSGDPNITRLSSVPAAPTPLKGGMMIRQFPTGWVRDPINPNAYSLIVGTLGFFAKDNIDGRVVGVTNRHVAVYNGEIAGEADVNQQLNNPDNTGEKITWIVDSQKYLPSASIAAGSAFNTIAFEGIKRYVPFYYSQPNYVDAALIIPKIGYVDNSSYQVWQPIDQPTYPTSLPFATTAELDGILVSNPKVYCTGVTSGPIGWGTGNCSINILGIGFSTVISLNGKSTTWSDQITMQTPLGITPMASGDSGSCVMADIGGVKKIIGLFFAGNSDFAIFNRIDKVANEMNISAFTTPIDTSIPSLKLHSASLSGYGNSKTISVNGKTYYQAGLTKNIYT